MILPHEAWITLSLVSSSSFAFLFLISHLQSASSRDRTNLSCQDIIWIFSQGFFKLVHLVRESKSLRNKWVIIKRFFQKRYWYEEILDLAVRYPCVYFFGLQDSTMQIKWQPLTNKSWVSSSPNSSLYFSIFSWATCRACLIWIHLNLDAHGISHPYLSLNG